MLQPDVDVGEVHMPSDHLQCGVAQDALEGEDVAAGPEKYHSGRMAEPVGMDPAPACPVALSRETRDALQEHRRRQLDTLLDGLAADKG